MGVEINAEGIEKRVTEVEGRVRSLDEKLSAFQTAVAETNNRFGGRIGKLEAKNDVQDEQVNQIKESLTELRQEMRSAQSDQKEAIGSLRSEHKESMRELKETNKEILDAVSPLKHEVESLKAIKAEVEELKSKPSKTWDTIKQQGITWGIGILLGLLAAVLGLSKVV